MTTPTMQGIDVIAAITSTSGPDDYYIDGPTPRARSILSACIHDKLYGYTCGPTVVGAAGEPGYEFGIARWDATNRRLRPVEIRGSHNGNQKVVWPPGEKLIQITAFSDMLTSMENMVDGPTKKVFTQLDRDKILATTDSGELPNASLLTGNELVTIVQGGVPKNATPNLIAGDPVTAKLGYQKSRSRDFVDLTRLSKSFAVTVPTTDAPLGAEPMILTVVGAGAAAINFQALTLIPCLAMSTGSTSSGRLCLEHTHYPIFYKPTERELDVTWTFTTGDTLPVSGQDYVVQAGFLHGVPNAATMGLYFEQDVRSPNWFAVVRSPDNAHLRRFDTLWALAPSTKYSLRVHYKPEDQETDFYINGVLVATMPHDGGGEVIPTNTRFAMALLIKKNTGSTASSITFLCHSHYVDRDPVEYH